MATLFVSDVHLSASRPRLVALFLKFLATDARAADALYILGDLFDEWVGDDAADAIAREVAAGLALLAGTGVPIYMMHGNRDFLLRPGFATTAGFRLIGDPTSLTLHGTPTVLTHGDLLCSADVRYQRARARYRRPWKEALFLRLPRAIRAEVARRLHAASTRSKRVAAPEIMDVTDEAVTALLRANDYPRVIHGHTHRPARHEHVIDGHRCERWVLGDWYARGSYLRCDAHGCAMVDVPQ